MELTNEAPFADHKNSLDVFYAMRITRQPVLAHEGAEFNICRGFLAGAKKVEGFLTAEK